MSIIETDRKPAPAKEHLDRLAEELHLSKEERELFLDLACIYRAELATCTGKTCHLAGEFPPPRRRGLPVQKRDHIL